MRKIISITIVGVMILTLVIGLFGGVVEEVEATATFDPNTNTIFIDFAPNTLSSIFAELNPVYPGLFYYDSIQGFYSTNASIQINGSGRLDITYSPTERALLFDYNDTKPLNLTVLGNLTVSGSDSGLFSFDSNRSNPSMGDWLGIIFSDNGASGSFINYAKIQYASIGIKCINANPSISNTLIANNLQNGIFIESSSLILKKNQILDNGDGLFTDGGIYVIDSTITIENCTLTNSPYNDILLQGNAVVTTLNSTFDIVLPSGSSYQLTVRWYLDILVTEDDGTTPITGANVYIENITGVPVVGSPFNTDVNGYAKWIKLTEYIQDSTSGKVDHTPHNITVTHNEYYTGYAKPNPQMTSSKKVQVNLTMLRRDLTTTTSDISFSPAGVPIAGEELWVRAKIYNVEVDDAHDVRVLIIDNAPEGGQTLHNSTIGEIKGNSSKNAADVWNPTPGNHMIEVYIDPYDTIPEINDSAPPGWAENNNYASTNISVNAIPLVNIIEPEDNDEINGTIFINGTAYDDTADDVSGLPGNDITRIDIRLEGYDWIELYPPNILPNGTPGGWLWFYVWDTTEWNGTLISDGNYTIQARSWDNYHFSHLYEVDITINNTGANDPPNAVITSPTEPNAFNVSDEITFDGSDSWDNETSLENLNFTWDFDHTFDSNSDGNFTNDEDGDGNITTFAYLKKGFFDVTLKVTDEGELNNTDTVTVWIWNYLPVANITADNTTVYENDTVYFDASDSYDPDGQSDLLSFLWDFDDGTPPIITTWPLTELNHSFNESRIFNVTLTVTDFNTTSNTTWIHINVLSNAQPNAVISDPDEYEVFSVNETIVFNASGSSDPNDEILEYWWDFGDGTNTSWSTNPYTNHSYSDVGTGFPPFLYYTVILSVRDNEGQEDTELITINVNNFPPVAIANSNVSTAPTNQSIEFDGSESYDPPPDPSTITYFWDFDDGSTEFGQIVEHEFNENGSYNVTLTVTDTDGVNNTDWIIINITNRDPVIEFVTYYPDPPTIVDLIYINITADDPDGSIVKYTWDFGDGESYYETQSDHSDGAFDGKTTHSYTIKNTYLVLIAVWDDDGNYSTTSFPIIIENVPPEVEITYPENDDTVIETVTISGSANDLDDGSVSYVEIRIDDFEWFQPEDTSGDSSWSTWSYDWDTEFGPYKVTNGMHTINARSFDEEDTESDPWAEISVDVNNFESDIFITENLDRTTVEAGGTIDVSGQVTYNTGDPVVGADVEIEILPFDNVWIAETSSSGHYTMNITAPDGDGSFNVRVKVSEGSFYDEEKVTINVTLTLQPDLGISTADIIFNPSTPDTGDTVTITITVWNYGTEDADDVLVSVYDGDPDDQGIQIDSKTINVILKESDEEIEIEWDTEDEYGLHNIHVVIDPADKINESDENNNEAQKAIDIEGQPDFSVGGISFSAEEPNIGDTVTIQITIYNNGTESDTVNYKVFDGDPGQGVVIEEGNKQISADRSSTVSVDWIPDEGGEHTIYVVLDPDDDITESDEDNNEGNRAITVKAPTEDGGIPSWLIPLTVIIAVIVIIILVMLNYRGKKKEPEKDLPVAEVVKTETKPKTQEAANEKEKEEEEEQESLIDTHGGIRIG